MSAFMATLTGCPTSSPGSAIGLSTGVFVMHRQFLRNSPVAFNLAPTEYGGISIQLTYTPRP